MTTDKQLEAMFQTLLEVEWLRKERFKPGLATLLKEATEDDQLEVVLHVLKNLTYCRSSDLVDAGHEAAKQIMRGWSLTPKDTIVVGVAELNKTCGSTAYLRCIETELSRDWSGGNAIWTTTDSVFQQRQGQPNLVLVDDFVGTGDKLGGLIDRIKNNPKTADFKVHVCTFAAMETGWDIVSTAVQDRLTAHRIIQRSISDLLKEPKRAQLLAAMMDLEKNLFNKSNKYSLGYKKSEAGFYLEGFNIPNNNFPLLWWENYANKNDRKTLFARR